VALERLEEVAQIANRGLWAAPELVPLWELRKL